MIFICKGDSPIRQQLNEISAYLDMELIYGNTEENLNAIRELGCK